MKANAWKTNHSELHDVTMDLNVVFTVSVLLAWWQYEYTNMAHIRPGIHLYCCLSAGATSFSMTSVFVRAVSLQAPCTCWRRSLQCSLLRIFGTSVKPATELRLHLLDIAPIQLHNARDKLNHHDNVSLHHQDSSKLEFASGKFDQTVVFFLLHEQPQEVRRKTTAEAIRVTRPGGKSCSSTTTGHGEAIRCVP
jgi:hypothetical protein